MTSLLRDVLPQARDEESAALIAAGQGSPGRALGFAGLDMAALDRALATIAAEGDPTNAERSKLAKSLALKAAQPRYEAFLDRTPSFIAAAAGRREGDRKSGVEGKGVSVRVDLGGRRIIKKNK